MVGELVGEAVGEATTDSETSMLDKPERICSGLTTSTDSSSDSIMVSIKSGLELFSSNRDRALGSIW